MPELAPVTTATRLFASAAVIETTLINVLNFSCASQRPVQHHHRVSLRGGCVLLPRTLPRLTRSRWGRSGHRTRTKDARALDNSHSHTPFRHSQGSPAVTPPDP